MRITNEEFLKVLFGVDYDYVHVTAFFDDPTNISPENRARCWSGGWFKNYNIPENTNQYFTISTFKDDNGKARRRKSLFRCTHVIVADDVNEKLPIENVQKLPLPTYKLQTSPGSEQWGWVLCEPCTDINKVDNLLDGLVSQGLAPSGKDPGMRGVTRYVRLPEGVNTKASKLINGMPVSCEMVEWHPKRCVSLDDLAAPFSVDLNVQAKSTRLDGAAQIDDHPLLQVVTIKEAKSAGRYDITCPWTSGHTNQSDDGAAIFTNEDGTIGFKCHHGSCQERTGKDLLDWAEQIQPGFKQKLKYWQTIRSFGGPPQLDFMGPVSQLNFMGPAALNFMGPVTQTTPINYQQMIDELRRIPPVTEEARQKALIILKAIDTLDPTHKIAYKEDIRLHIGWTKAEIQQIIDYQQKNVWYKKDDPDTSFYKECVYVAEQDQLYNPSKRLWQTATGFQNMYGHIDPDARQKALNEGLVEKVERLDYAPGMAPLFVEEGIRYVNGWSDDVDKGTPGDCSRWLEHFKIMGWQEYQKHILQWMAYTLRHPETKINHALILAGRMGSGKDFIMQPLVSALKHNAKPMDANELLDNFNEYLLSTKFLFVGETNIGDHKDSKFIANKIKSMCAAPPHVLRINIKGVRPVIVRNIVNVAMNSNYVLPVATTDDERRLYAIWTDLNIRNEERQVIPEWDAYWTDRWNWMLYQQDGWKACVYYLMTQVDLSDFNPGSSPMVTEFLKEMQEACQDPVAIMIKEFIRRKLSLMGSDLVTSNDIFNSLRTAAIAGVDVIVNKIPTPQTLGKIMKQEGLGIPMRARRGKMEHKRMWIIRNFSKYNNMNVAALYDEYEKQICEIRSSGAPKIVEVK
jgi:hypothetical protein